MNSRPESVDLVLTNTPEHRNELDTKLSSQVGGPFAPGVDTREKKEIVVFGQLTIWGSE